MNEELKRILNAKNIEEKLNEVKKAIEIAEEIQNGKFTYCKKCDDYYLSKSFITEQEIIEENVCVYSDPINSSGDEYKRQKVRYTYKICPKGCKHTVNREEHWLESNQNRMPQFD